MPLITTDDEASGGGYPDMLAAFRNSSGSGNPSIRDSPSGDPSWFDRLASVAERQSRARQEQEQRDEETRREQERMRQQAEQRQQEAARQEQLNRDKFKADNADRFGDNTDAAYDTIKNGKDAINQWAQTTDGYRFLSAGGANKVDYAQLSADPYKTLSKNDNIREFNFGFPAYKEGVPTTPEDMAAAYNNLKSRGVPDDVIKALQTHLSSRDGEETYQKSGGQAGGHAADPIAEAVTAKTGSEFLGGLASGVSQAIPILGAANAGASGSNTNVRDPKFWNEAGSVGLNAGLSSGLAGAIDKAAVSAFEKVLPATAAKIAGRSAAGAAINAGFAGAGQAAAGEFDPKGLGLAAAMGAALPVIHPAFNAVLHNVPTEFKTAAATYVTAKSLGADDEEARNYALMAAGATAVSQRGFKEALASGFGMKDLLGTVSEFDPTTGGVRETVKIGGMTYDPSPSVDPEVRLAAAQKRANESLEKLERLDNEAATPGEWDAAYEELQAALKERNAAAGPGTSLITDGETGLTPRAQANLTSAGGHDLVPTADGAGAPPIPPIDRVSHAGGEDNMGGQRPADSNTFPRSEDPTKTTIYGEQPDVVVPEDNARIDKFVSETPGQVHRPEVAQWLDSLQTRARGEGDSNLGNAVATAISLPKGVVNAISPAGKFSLRVLEAATASWNMGNYKAMELIRYVDDIKKVFGPIMGEEVSQVLKREAVRAVPAGLGFATGMALGGPDTKEGRQAMATGLFLTYAAHSGDVGVSRRVPANMIKYRTLPDGGLESQRSRGAPVAEVRVPEGLYTPPLSEQAEGRVPLKGMARGGKFSDTKTGLTPADLPASLQTPAGRLIHMIVYPGDFDLSPKQLAAVQSGQKLMAALFEQVRLVQKASGQAVTEDLKDQNPRLFQFFTPDSVEKVLGKEYFKAGSGMPGFAARLPFEQNRMLGENIVEAMINHPDLKPIGDPLTLMTKDLEMKARKIANLTLVRGLTKGNEGEGWVKDRTTELEPRLKAAEAAREATAPDSLEWTRADIDVQALKAAGKEASQAEAEAGGGPDWAPIKGVAGFKFPPEILKSVEDLAVERPGEYGSLMDRVTSDVRTMMFSGDASAWTMQGLMLAASNPIAFLSHSVPLLMASIKGDSFTAARMRDPKFNAGVEEFTGAGGVTGRGGSDETITGQDIKHVPIIHQLENRGFENFLPVARTLMYTNLRDSYALLEKYGGGGTLGKFGLNHAVGAAEIGARLLPAVAGVAAGNTQDEGSWERYFLYALGGAGSLATHAGIGKMGASAYESLSAEAQHSARIRAAAEINRSSGVLNKAAKGITKGQARTERNWFFRSPALIRNTAEIAKMAVGTGPEAVMAQRYILQTAMLVGSLAVAAKLATGSGMDSLDPSDPNSVLNPRNFAKIGMGEKGVGAQSNPIMALVRAAFYHQGAEGEPGGGWGLHGPRDVASGLAGYVENRLPDISGQLSKIPFDYMRTGSPAGSNPSPLFATMDALKRGDAIGVAGNVARLGVPIAAQTAAQAGITGLPLVRSDPSYNHLSEQLTGPLAELAGFSYSPETRMVEGRRRTDAAIRDLVSNNPEYKAIADSNGSGLLDRRDLPDALREKFDATPVGQELRKFGDETRAQGGMSKDESQLDKYFTYLDGLVDRHVGRLKAIEAEVAAGRMSKFDYRQAYLAEQKQYSAEKKDLNNPEVSPFKGQMMDHKVWDPETKTARDMSVLEYQKRGEHVEDANVSTWFSLYDKATGADGKLDFDKLDQLQADFRKTLPEDQSKYLDDRLASFKDRGVRDSQGGVAELPTLKEYSDVKDAAAKSGFWDAGDKYFQKAKEMAAADGATSAAAFLGQFKDYRALTDWADTVAAENGADRSTIMKMLGLSSLEEAATANARIIRGDNLKMDIGLQDFYERPAANQYAYWANQQGDHQFDSAGPALARMKPISAKERLGLANKYGRGKPLASYFRSD